ncbi:VOC family protein [Acidaminobacter sp. JC074]|uniref:VOC family protein n=1 Tax=Acidaminobacter sp. JC074 TaxID=2530199 RepID=UPI001F0F920D|nr:VOC family protein [Acidaminobacter sp. JC074]MCH4886029.1 VOC family protein [Acidaminobacter sp. JC074]
MKIHTYVNFQGQAKEAITFYAEILGTNEPNIMYYKDLPPDPNFPVPEACKDWVMHGSINYNDQIIMFSDQLPHVDYKQSNAVGLLIDLDDEKALKALYDKFSDGATIEMPFAETFWAKGFGSLIDKFGIYWQFNCS